VDRAFVNMRQSCGSANALNALGGALGDLFDIFGFKLELK
jgi:hypothetical protein